MLRRIALIALIAGGYAAAMYTEVGCAPYESPTEPLPHARLEGTVLNAASGVVIAGATVRMTQSGVGYSTTSDNTGRYSIGISGSGDWVVEAAANGFRPFSQTVTMSGTIVLNINLVPV